MKKKRKYIELAVLFGLIAAILISFARFDTECENLRENVFRLHIVAHSDAAEDQAVKLLIRDRIVERAEKLFSGDRDLKSAIAAAKSSNVVFTDIANDTLRENGFDYRAVVTVGDTYFDTRVYDDFSLPAGVYKSLNIRLGNAAGKNWWCVIYPSVCLNACKSHSLSESADRHSVRIAKRANKYKICFKSVEIYEKIRHFFKK